MPYAIVDIETTGGHASANSITEVSVQVHDGEKVIKRFETLIKPGQKIPYYITGLTGITNNMVANAPPFNQIAGELYQVLEGCVFVAHSVNFDYSFLKRELEACGYQLNLKKLCTVRLSRKIFPGLPSYSLGKICAYLDIAIKDRHRAGGDAAATVLLFEKLLANDSEGLIAKSLKRNSKEHVLPPNVNRADFEKLPQGPGVYYFHDSKGKIVYVGKALNIKKRVSSHFSNNSPSKQKQDFMRTVHGITFEECGNELMALILESHQIKQLWPAFNRSQKRFEPVFGLVEYYDQRGFRRLSLEKMRKNAAPPLVALSNLHDGYTLLRSLITDYKLCPRLAGIATDTTACLENGCHCMKEGKKNISAYNKKVKEATAGISKTESFVIIEQGRKENESALVVVENGSFKKMGYLPRQKFTKTKLRNGSLEGLPLYRDNFNIKQIISSYRLRMPENVVVL
ncbi:MAG TPA: exonuclease domain-containing protein [Chitinophagales bacterium]|nr:exonuclease domain-containing protein [Chitinophagales bacterium]